MTAHRAPRVPRPTHCVECHRRLLASDHKGNVPDGCARYGGYGQCRACYQRNTKTGTATPTAPRRPTNTTPDLIAGAELHGDYLSTAPNVTPDIARAAALQVCAWATNPTDARDLLTTLGLLRNAA